MLLHPQVCGVFSSQGDGKAVEDVLRSSETLSFWVEEVTDISSPAQCTDDVSPRGLTPRAVPRVCHALPVDVDTCVPLCPLPSLWAAPALQQVRLSTTLATHGPLAFAPPHPHR